MESWCLDFEEVDHLVASSWAHPCQGSALYKVQRKLASSINKCKAWCLKFKEKNKIQWDHINHELAEAQDNLGSDSFSPFWAEKKKKLRVSTDIKLE